MQASLEKKHPLTISLENLLPLRLKGKSPEEIKQISEKNKIRKASMDAFRDFFEHLPEIPISFYDYQEELKFLIHENPEEGDVRWKKLDLQRKNFNIAIQKSFSNQSRSESLSWEQLNSLYPEQSQEIQNIVNLLQNTNEKDIQKIEGTIKSIAHHLQFPENKFLSFFQNIHQKPVDKDDATQKLEEKVIRLISSQMINLEIGTSKIKSDKEVALLNEKFEALDLFIPSKIPESLKEFKNNLKKYIYDIDAAFDAVKSKKPEEILGWAKQNKGKLSKNDIQALCVNIAWMERAYELTTLNDAGEGHRLRDVQKIAILVFMLSEQGHISEIFTGEGKTTIISLVQALKIFQGYKGHIITSNPVLAEEGVNDKRMFYTLLNISTGHNNPLVNSDQIKSCYTRDLVYGCIGNFQFDWLRHVFEQNKTMGEMDFTKIWVMLDEIDSLLIDQGGHIAKLSSPFPGMDSLRYVYVNIWTALIQAETEILESLKKNTDDRLEAYLKSANVLPSPSVHACQEFNCALNGHFFKEIMKRIQTQEMIPEALVPGHLRSYLERNMEQLIRHAFIARYYYCENVEYRILHDGEEDIIVPVDNENTGVSHQNTILSNGLHQFLQLKHNLALTWENLTSCYISNLNYIKLYKNNLSGVTGTLGSTAEQKLLGSIFELSFSRIPSHIKKSFETFPGQILEDDTYIDDLARRTLEITPRAVLIICNSMRDVDLIETAIQKMSFSCGLNPRIKIYKDESRTDIPREMVTTNDIVIATNIASRGTDFKTTRELEACGGLHVITAFLPCNQRVQYQAEGRTSRQGNKGSAEMIIRQSELVQSGFSFDGFISDFKNILEQRDSQENLRLKNIRRTLIPELEFKDQLFNHFCQIYSSLKNQHQCDNDLKYLYVMLDLKERWAFWLDEQDFTIDGIRKLQGINTEEKTSFAFQQFINLDDTKRIIISKAHTWEIGEITWNPYYLICLAERYLEEYNADSFEKAIEALRNAISISKHSEILYSAHHKLFEVILESSGQIIARLADALKFLGLRNLAGEKNSREYKSIAYQHLCDAKSSIIVEHNYLGSLLGLTNSDKPGLIDIILISSKNRKNPSDTKHPVNFFMKGLHARYVCLDMYLRNIESMMGQLKDIIPVEKDVIIGIKIPRYLANLNPGIEHQKELQSVITQKEVDTLEFVGISSVLQLQELHPVPQKILTGVQIQVATAVAMLSFTIAVPAFMPTLGALAVIILTEAICDVIYAMLDPGHEAFNEEKYLNAKYWSYALSLVCLGITVARNNYKIVSQALSLCRSLTSRLNKIDGPFSIICKMAEKALNILKKHLENSLDKIVLAQASRTGKVDILNNLHKVLELNPNTQGIKKFYKLAQMKDAYFSEMTSIIGCAFKNSTKNVAFNLIIKQNLFNALFQVMNVSKPFIERQVSQVVLKKYIEHKSILDKFTKETLYHELELLFASDLDEDLLDILKKIGLGVLESSKNWKMQLSAVVIDASISAIDIITLTTRIFDKFLDGLHKKSPSLHTVLNSLAEKELTNLLSSGITEILYQKLVLTLSNGIVKLPSITYQGYKQYQVNSLQQKAIYQISENLHLAKTANMDASCTLRAFGSLFEMNINDVMHSLGMVTSPYGASLQDIRKIFMKNDFYFKECELDSLADTFIKMKSDRAIAFFSRNDGMGHAEFLDNSIDVEDIKLIISENNFTCIKILVPKDFSQYTLAEHQFQMKKNRLKNVSTPILLSGQGQGIHYGALHSNLRKYNIQVFITTGKFKNTLLVDFLRDNPSLTPNAIHGSSNDEMLQTAKFEYWRSKDLVMEFFACRIPTEEIVWVLSGEIPQLAGHSGALRRTNKLSAFVTFKQETFHTSRTQAIMNVIRGPNYIRNASASFEIMATGLDFTINNTAGKVQIQAALNRNIFLFSNLTGTNGDLSDAQNRENFINKIQVARDIKKCLVIRSDELSGRGRTRAYSNITSRSNTFFQEQLRKIEASTTLSELGDIAMHPAPYDRKTV